MQQNVRGRVVLDCLVDGAGRLDCTVVSEEPPGYGFAEATLEIAREYRMATHTADGTPTEGGRVRVPITWRILF